MPHLTRQKLCHLLCSLLKRRTESLPPHSFGYMEVTSLLRFKGREISLYILASRYVLEIIEEEIFLPLSLENTICRIVIKMWQIVFSKDNGEWSISWVKEQVQKMHNLLKQLASKWLNKDSNSGLLVPRASFPHTSLLPHRVEIVFMCFILPSLFIRETYPDPQSCLM